MFPRTRLHEVNRRVDESLEEHDRPTHGFYGQEINGRALVTERCVGAALPSRHRRCEA
jgi:hypothetical protein